MAAITVPAAADCNLRKLSANEPHREPRQTVEAIVCSPGRIAGQLEPRDLLSNGFQECAQCRSHNTGTDAGMGAETEAEVRIGRPRHVEPVGAREDPLVAVRRCEPGLGFAGGA